MFSVMFERRDGYNFVLSKGKKVLAEMILFIVSATCFSNQYYFHHDCKKQS